MKKFVLFAMSAALLVGTAAKADPLTITLSAPFQFAGPSGGVLAFNATVTNTTNQTEDLVGDSFNVDAPLSVDDTPFFSTPATLGAFQSFTAVLFLVDIPAGTPTGLYAGSFEIIGGPDPIGGQDVIGTTNFDVEVTPEPSSLLLLATGFAGVGGVLRRRLIG